MAFLSLSNHNLDSETKKIRFDLRTGQFTTDNEQIVSKQDLMTRLAFIHPLLSESIPFQKSGTLETYVYQNMDELALALRYFYAKLLSMDNPAGCQVHVKPTAQYQAEQEVYEIYFSCHPQQIAKKRLSSNQLNLLILSLRGHPFQYSNRILLDKILTITDLPEMMDGDALYQPALSILQCPTHQVCLDQYELRYLGQTMGFGVFARTQIEKGDFIAQYCGKFSANEPIVKNYAYLPQENMGLHLVLDAMHYGNLSRFINHAPSPETQNPTRSKFLTANVVSEKHFFYGNRYIAFVAARTIAVGEQVLFDYGAYYFDSPDEILRITRNGAIIDAKQQRVKDTEQQKKQSLFAFAQHGVQDARWLVLRRPVMALMVCVMISVILDLIK